MGQHRTRKRVRTFSGLCRRGLRATVPGRKQKVFPCPTSTLFIDNMVSNNTFQPILKDTPFPRLFPSPRQEKSQHAGYRGQKPGVCTILGLSMQVLRQLNPGHNGRKQQPLSGESSQHAACEISACRSWKGSKDIPSISSGTSSSPISGLRRQIATDLTTSSLH